MFKEIQIWDCPYCGKSTIEVIYFPKTARPQKTSWGGSKAWMKVSNETIIVKSGCSSCGKSQNEVEKKLLK